MKSGGKWKLCDYGFIRDIGNKVSSKTNAAFTKCGTPAY